MKVPGQRCRDLCKPIQMRKRGFSTSPYVEGLKKCIVCAVYLKTDSKYCPCCNYLLRTRARSKKSKMFSEMVENHSNRFYGSEDRTKVGIVLLQRATGNAQH